ncbi:MAG: hypothetical protein C4321_02885 [Chloroflexota bacterium]
MRRHHRFKVGMNIGLEITPVELRAVEVALSARQLVVQRVSRVEAPEGCVREGQVLNPDALAGALRRLWEKGGFSRREVVVSVPDCVLTEQMLKVPPAPPAEQRTIVRGELDRFATVTPESHFDFLPMADDGGPGGNTLAFLVEEGVIRGYQEALERAGLASVAFEPAGMAALRSVQLGTPPRENSAVVYVGETCSEMAFLEEGRLRYFRRLDPGLREMTGMPEGERRFFEHGPEHSELARFIAAQDLTALPAHRDGSELAPLAQEIRRSLQYYARSYGEDSRPGYITLLGDYSALDALGRRLSDELNIECEYGHPFTLYPHAPGMTDQYVAHAGDHFLVPLGLALRGAAARHAAPVLDLGRSDQAQVLAGRTPRSLTVSLATSLGIVVISIIASLFLGQRLRQADAELASANAALLQANTEHAARLTQVQEVSEQASVWRRKAMPIARLLTYFGAMAPESLAFTTLNVKEDGSLEIEGAAATPQQVNILLQQLSYSQRFRAPVLESLDVPVGESLTRFKLQSGLMGFGKPATEAGAS